MKPYLRNLFSPILKHFESGEGTYSYKKSHRTILLIVGGLFLILACISTAASIATAQAGGAIPILVFFGVSFTCLIVGGLGTDNAVANIWKRK